VEFAPAEPGSGSRKVGWIPLPLLRTPDPLAPGAALPWDRPARFRRVCPLLVNTPDGLRCSVATADVRPIWMPVARYYGSAALALYAAGVVSVFAFLQTVGYPVCIVQVALPPLWHKVAEARGWFFLERSNRALAAGNSTEGCSTSPTLISSTPPTTLPG
jgi:hypothetical protein